MSETSVSKNSAGEPNVAAIVHLPSAAGHFLVYAQCFVEAAHRCYDKVYVLVPETEPAADFESLTGQGASLISYRSVWPSLSNLPALYAQLSGWLGVLRACRGLSGEELAAGRTSHLILTYVDMFSTAFALVKPPATISRTFAMTMRADIGQHDQTLVSFAARLKRGLKHRLWRYLLARPFAGLFATNDPCLIQSLQVESASAVAGAPARALKQRSVVLLEDFSFCHGDGSPSTASVESVDSHEPLKSRHERGELRVIALGYLDSRKNLGALLRAVLDCRQRLGHAVHLTLAGHFFHEQLGAEAAAALKQLQAQAGVTLVNEFVNETRYRELIADSDVVWAVYRNHPYASGVVLDAIAAGCAVLAQSEGVIGFYAKRSGQAICVDANASFEQIAQALCELRALKRQPTRHRVQTRAQYVESAALAFARMAQRAQGNHSLEPLSAGQH